MSRVEQSTKLDLERIIFIGRTFEEYLDLFSLSKEELEGKKILDCPAGACSFTAVSNKSGLDVTACDIAYYHSIEDLKNKGLQDIEHAMEHMQKAQGNYIWDYFKDIEGLKKHRLSALKDCAKDMRESSERYVPVTLPSLPFEDAEFDILLSAHFLFMYADRLDYQFHIKTLNEFLRVTKEEIRIFPLVDLEGKRYEHLDKLISYLVGNGCRVEEVKVPYEFQVNANSMLKIKKG
ncbi:SAM-dependent methyltransferase [Bacillus sp. ISL-40]|uniref:class I SAM-dependent methyltransferase n=1 Tax=unclassified Bacillus (in: firmicutes) TaxID=185979 RepID=UPI001BEC3BAF|nr:MULTISPECIES: class I SAM-dependent methyltransferase [unclassified Bacillus (in: firmicutes)]MBT2698659.1 SAM-dependent methyltransferase [Bacillus sp. ISL-40]MBT2720292.1 SAM-dependent methyltransferase [Bacillus sp. ISL-46]MBT2739114.1 SAM-dependent methyltransferase [Bacillus sp. ISL-77]